MYLKHITLLILGLTPNLLGVCFAFAIPNVGTISDPNIITLVEHSRSNYQIVISGNAAEGVREAAFELQRLIRKSSGVSLKVASNLLPGKKYFFVGDSAYTRRAGINGDDLAPDSYILSMNDGNVYLVGHDDRRQGFYTLNTNQSASAGSYYAVIDFARRFLNARWYMPGPLGEEIDAISNLVVPNNLYVKGGPAFGIRYIDITTTKSVKKERHLRRIGAITGHYFNADAAEQATRWGRHLRVGSNFQLSVGHSWHQWMPAEKPSKFSTEFYGVSKPEYYSQPGGRGFFGKYYHGKEENKGGQLCLCNSDMAEAFAENIITYAEKSGERSFSLSPNDGGWGECSCQCCRENPNRYKKYTPQLTEELIRFSNKVADRVTEQIPDARFGLYLYNDMAEPPSTGKSRNNIFLSDVYNGLAYIHHEPNELASTERKIRQWRERANNIVMTTYYTFYGHYSLPWSTIDTHRWLFEQFAGNRSSAGLRMNYALLDMPPIGALGPDPWVLSELLWNPDQSAAELEKEFYNRAFGPEAGTVIRQYFSIISGSMASAIADHPFKKAGGVKNYIVPAYSPIREKCRELIDQAVDIVSRQDKRFRWRVDRVARAWRLAELTLDMLEADANNDEATVNRLIASRKSFLAEPGNIFAIAPVSVEYQESIAPLLK